MSSKQKSIKKFKTGDKILNIFLYVIVFCAIVVLIFCLSQIVPKLLEYRQSDSSFEQMQDSNVTKYDPITANSDSDVSSDVDVSDALSIDWDAFQGTEIVAWFQLDDISYPIMQHTDNSYYLHHLPDGSYNGGGSIFLLNHNNPLFTDKSSFVYGHNMGNGSMFGRLKNYMTDASKDHLFYIYLPDGTRHVYQFFSVATVFQESKAYTWSFASDDSYMNWQQWMLDKSRIGTSCTASKDARYVTLSTCNGYAGTNHRLVICGQEIRVDKLQSPASWYDSYLEQYNAKAAAKQQRADDILSQLQAVQKSKMDALDKERNGLQ